MNCFSLGDFPPGFRFHPSDEELIQYYLHNKVTSHPLPAVFIAEIDLYKYNPWELPKKALFGEDEWYFFSPRDRKYPNGARPNRAAASGYWKATGTDKPILALGGSKNIGVKKSLVFYSGRPPKGIKTDWIMNEYRLPDSIIKPSRQKGSMRLDDWVLCRVRHKGSCIPIYAGDDHHRVNSVSTVDDQSKDFQRMVSLLTSKSLVHATKIITSFSVQGSCNNGGSENAVTNPIYEKTLKRSAPESNRDEEGVTQAGKKQYIDGSDEDLLSKVLGECGGLEEQCNQEQQYQNYSFNMQRSDSIIDFQALHDLSFQ